MAAPAYPAVAGSGGHGQEPGRITSRRCPGTQCTAAHMPPPPAYPTPSAEMPPPAGPAAPAALQARLYPSNEVATETGMLSGTVTNMMTGKGFFQLNYKGEILSGEATRVPGDERRGLANAYGQRGTYMTLRLPDDHAVPRAPAPAACRTARNTRCTSAADRVPIHVLTSVQLREDSHARVRVNGQLVQYHASRPLAGCAGKDFVRPAPDAFSSARRATRKSSRSSESRGNRAML